MRIKKIMSNKWMLAILIGIILGCILAYPIPFFVMEPGSAMEIRSTIKIKQHPPEKNGQFYLTTVSVREAMVFDYLWDVFSSQMELVEREKMVIEGESEEEYDLRQKQSMIRSQHFAMIAAFQQTKHLIKYTIQGQKIMGFASRKVKGLKLGDVIKKIDQQKVTTLKSMVTYLQGKKAKEVVTLLLARNKKTLTQKVRLISLPDKRVGIGILLQPQMRVQSSPPVTFSSNDIGGPSAGLMFSLEIADRLLPINLTNGKKIAGTGTIDQKGRVGQIGGIQYKIIAAANEGAEIFLCPKDITAQDNNEKIAKQTVKEQGIAMRVIPVRSLAEAIQVLQEMGEKSKHLLEGS